MKEFIRGLIAELKILKLIKQDLKSVKQAIITCKKLANQGQQVSKKKGPIKIGQCCSIFSK